MRCFIALGLEPEPGPTMEAGLLPLRGFRELSVPPAENLHITLAFMGDLADAELVAAREALGAAAAAAGGSWRIDWGKAGAFPSLARPQVVWLGLAEPAITATVQGLLVAELRARGLPADERPFRPHLTLARVRAGLRRERVEALKTAMAVLLAPAAASVDSLVLYRSRQGRGAAVYEELARASV